MSKQDIIRSWKDKEYRQSLSTEERKLLPEHPAGAVQVADEELAEIQGGYLNTIVLCIVTLTCTVTFSACIATNGIICG